MEKLTLSGFVFMVLLGLWASAGHYFAPRPTAEMLENMTIAPGVEWFTHQLPLYEQHAMMTALHVVPAFLFMALILLQLSPGIRRRAPQVHRWSGRLFVVLSVAIGISGLMLGVIMPYGGGFETVVILLMGALFLYSLAMGVIRIRQRRVVEHRFWMLHMVAVAFAPITMRILLAIGMYATDFTGPELFGPTMLLGSLLNLMLLHGWILRRPLASRAPAHTDKAGEAA